jgi:hypothetical protein
MLRGCHGAASLTRNTARDADMVPAAVLYEIVILNVLQLSPIFYLLSTVFRFSVFCQIFTRSCILKSNNCFLMAPTYLTVSKFVLLAWFAKYTIAADPTPTCVAFGVDFQDGGSYFQNILSTADFTFVSEYEGLYLTHFRPSVEQCSSSCRVPGRCSKQHSHRSKWRPI